MDKKRASRLVGRLQVAIAKQSEEGRSPTELLAGNLVQRPVAALVLGQREAPLPVGEEQAVPEVALLSVGGRRAVLQLELRPRGGAQRGGGGSGLDLVSYDGSSVFEKIADLCAVVVGAVRATLQDEQRAEAGQQRHAGQLPRERHHPFGEPFDGRWNSKGKGESEAAGWLRWQVADGGRRSPVD